MRRPPSDVVNLANGLGGGKQQIGNDNARDNDRRRLCWSRVRRLLCRFGHQVTCIDKDAAKIAALNRGEIRIFEPGLSELVESNVRQGRLEFAAEASRIGEADAVFIAVGTPSRRGDGHADLSLCGRDRD